MVYFKVYGYQYWNTLGSCMFLIFIFDAYGTMIYFWDGEFETTS